LNRELHNNDAAQRRKSNDTKCDRRFRDERRPFRIIPTASALHQSVTRSGRL